jgi:hypothetical protein
LTKKHSTLQHIIIQGTTFSNMQRQVTAAVRANIPARSRSASLHSTSLTNASLAAFPVEASGESISIPQILDIFDAPARLGESSRIHQAIARASSPVERSPRAVAARPPPSRLPSPVLFDRPAQPRDMYRSTYFGEQEYSTSSSTLMSPRPRTAVMAPTRSRSSSSSSIVSSLSEANVEMFDGPSRRMPYGSRSYAKDEVSSLSFIIRIIVFMYAQKSKNYLALAGAAGAFGLVAFGNSNTSSPATSPTSSASSRSLPPL